MKRNFFEAENFLSGDFSSSKNWVSLHLLAFHLQGRVVNDEIGRTKIGLLCILGWGEKKVRVVQMCVNEQKRDLLITCRSKVYAAVVEMINYVKSKKNYWNFKDQTKKYFLFL